MSDDGPIGQVNVQFVCTDRGAHAPLSFGWVSYSELDDDEPPVFIRSRGVEPGHDQLSHRLDDKCPRCGRHPKYNAQTLHKIVAAILAANLDEARS
jgi:hypothetical protein